MEENVLVLNIVDIEGLALIFTQQIAKIATILMVCDNHCLFSTAHSVIALYQKVQDYDRF